MKISASVIKEKSFDPVFQVRFSYEDEGVNIKGAIAEVQRRPPRVKVEYPEDIRPLLPKVNVKKLELEIMNKIVEFLLSAKVRKPSQKI